MIDKEKEKQLILADMRKVLTLIHEAFPWIAVELALSMKTNLNSSEQDNPFVIEAFKGILDDISQEVLEQHLPECPPVGASMTQTAISVFNSYKTKQNVEDVLAKPLFSLDEEVNNECLPWDEEERKSATQLGMGAKSASAKLKAIQNIKMGLRELAFHKAVIAKDKESFKDEYKAIEIIFEVLDFIN